jgi:diguanylate cyclase (GGDEF)-like protein
MWEWLRVLLGFPRRTRLPRTSDAFESRKRQIFLVALALGIVFIVVDSLIRINVERASPSGLIPMFGLGVCFVVLFVMLWRWPHWQGRVELGVVALSASYLLINFYSDFERAQLGLVFNLSVKVLQNAQWLMVVYLVSFLIFTPEQGLRLSALMYLGSLLIGLAFMLPRWWAGEVPDGSYALVQFYIASAVILIFLYRIGSLRQRYVLVDFLTGLSNRRHIYTLLSHETERSKRYGQPFSVILFDVDHFKRINDTHGHLSGDQVLREISRLTAEKLRTVDDVGRWGGEEFLILLPETGLSGAHLLADRLRQVIATQTFGSVGAVTASFGVTEYQLNDSPESMLARADAALYSAKRAGRNRVCVEALEAAPQTVSANRG